MLVSIVFSLSFSLKRVFVCVGCGVGRTEILDQAGSGSWGQNVKGLVCPDKEEFGLYPLNNGYP